MQREIAHDIVVIADSDIAVERDYLARLIARARAARRGARHVPVSRRAARRAVGATRGDGDRLSLLARRARRTRAGIRAALLRIDDRATPRNAAGDRRIRCFRDKLADDYAIGAAVRAAGLTVAIPPLIVRHGFSERSRVRLAAARIALGTNAAGSEPRRLRRARNDASVAVRASGGDIRRRGSLRPDGRRGCDRVPPCPAAFRLIILWACARAAAGSVRARDLHRIRGLCREAFSSASSAGAAIAIVSRADGTLVPLGDQQA